MSSTLIQEQVLQTLEFVMCARCTLHETQSETQGQQQPCSKYICVKSYFYLQVTLQFHLDHGQYTTCLD